MRKIIAIIPARSGSKALPDKNILPLCGKPLMAYTIECAKQTGIFDEIHVSTDSEDYAEIARQYGAEVPFLRESSLASDVAGSFEVVSFVLDEYKKMGREFDVVILLQPTSPLRNPRDIIEALELFDRKGADSVVSVCETDYSPMWCGTLSDNLSLNGFIPKSMMNKPRQELETYYRINGAIYIVSTSHITPDINLYGVNSFAYIMLKERSIDIDTMLDFKIAECLVNKL